MPRFSRITKKLIETAVANSDLNDALFHFQNAINIDSGDVAALVFACGLDDEWPAASLERRREMMRTYIDTERRWAQ